MCFVCIFVDLLAKLLESAKENVNEADAKIPSSESSAFRRRHTSPADAQRNKEPDYTPDQLEQVKRIKKWKQNIKASRMQQRLLTPVLCY